MRLRNLRTIEFEYDVVLRICFSNHSNDDDNHNGYGSEDNVDNGDEDEDGDHTVVLNCRRHIFTDL